MNRTTDLHIHTLVSDGVSTPLEMLAAAKDAGLKKISITDHDALGAYRHWGDLFAPARELGIELVQGIELDADFQRREVHLLGYGFRIDDPALNGHLAATQRIRKQRVRLQLAIINQFFKRKVVDSKKVFLPQRDTLMKPHLVHAMIDQGLFADYRQAAGWLSDIVRVQIHVPKLPLADAIAMIRNAGGEAILAHPGFISRESGVPLGSLLAELVSLGLSGLEVDYPYLGTGPAFPDLEAEKEMIGELRALAVQFNLKSTRGSDAHDVEALKAFARRSEVTSNE